MLALLPIALAFQVSASVRVGADSAERAKLAELRAEREAYGENGRPGRISRPARRIPLTDELRATAFRDPAARELLLRARAARMVQDSALGSYEATTYQRISAGLGFHVFGRDRLAFRHEDATHVVWQRGVGALVDVKGSRTVVPIAGAAGKEADGDVDLGGAVPYYPGREELWIGGGMARAEVDERAFVHPIAEGAEAYYTYQTGDSVIMTLPDGRRITLRELRIQARWPQWNIGVGSFWFDVATAHLVRAVYRLSSPLDVWAEVARDSSARKDTPVLAKAMLSPMKVDVSAITVEYGLYNQRFWLPRAAALEGVAQVSFMHVPVTLEQRVKYQAVNELQSPVPMPPPPDRRIAILRDSLDSAKTPRPQRDSLVRQAARVRAKELAAAHVRECAETGSYTMMSTRSNGSLRIATRIPCDSAKLVNSPELPGSIYDSGEALFSMADRDALVKSLSFGLQSGWAPQKPTVDWGLAYTRYNRVEGLGTGFALKSQLGDGYTAEVDGRGSLADRELNGALAISRTNGRSTLQASIYRRLDVMNDWGTPLSFGASMASLLYARDEGAYYRTWGAELTGTHPSISGLDWRVFAEQEWKADVNSRWTLFGGGNDTRFIANPAAQQATEYGASARLHSSAGLDPDGFRWLSDVRAEDAGGDYSYARGLFDATLSHALTSMLAASLTASAGYTAGTVPVQRLFYLGGLQTVRGQTALTASGDAFWLSRAELGLGTVAARYIVFGDVGWAGDRRDFSSPGRPLSGTGVGASFLDGLVRVDLARGLYPAKQWRLDLYLEAKF
jgi:hypothetical protein